MTELTTREIALDGLMEILEEDRFCHIVLGQLLDKYGWLPHRERAFLNRLVEGTVEYRLQEDYVINLFSSTKVSRMKPLIRTLLRMSAYQIFYMDRVPSAAICNEAVKLAGKRGFTGLKGFVNGVLRAIVRKKEKIIWPDDYIRLSLPVWMLDDMTAFLGRDRAVLAGETMLQPARPVIRCRGDENVSMDLRARLAEKHIEFQPLTSDGCVLALDGADVETLDELTEEGLAAVQDLSSVLAGRCAGFQPGGLVLDVCGAPGGKSIHAADLMRGEGEILIRDVSEAKLPLMEENIRRSGWNNIRAQVWDARVFDPSWEMRADIVIADLPCSGLGVMGRKPDIRWRTGPQQVRELAALQKEILDTVWRYVKPGGRLVYSTCTMTDAENLQNFRYISERYPFKPVDILPAMQCSMPGHWDPDREADMRQGHLQLIPGTDPCDGFFIGVLERIG